MIKRGGGKDERDTQHTQNMTDSYKCKYEACKIPHGRLSLRWEDNIKIDLKEMGCRD